MQTLGFLGIKERKKERNLYRIFIFRFIIALVFFIPILVSAFIFMQIKSVERAYMAPVFRGIKKEKERER